MTEQTPPEESQERTAATPAGADDSTAPDVATENAPEADSSATTPADEAAGPPATVDTAAEGTPIEDAGSPPDADEAAGTPATVDTAAEGTPIEDAGILPATVESGTEAAASDTGSEASPGPPAPSAVPKPSAPKPSAPRPSAPRPGPVPTPAAVRPVAHPSPAAAPAAPSGPPAETFGRVDENGTVYVRVGDGEREVGAYPGATAEEALHYFARKYDELFATADLLHQRLITTDLSSRDAKDALVKLREHIGEANVVGDLAALEAKVAEIESAIAARKESEAAERTQAREHARKEREAIVAEAEAIAAQPESKIQWKQSGARMRALLDEWKRHQRSGARLDRETETALWQRFSHARNSFDKARRVHFAQLESSQAEAKAAKLALVAEAEALSTSTDWGSTAGAYKRLMDRWRKAGRASRADDDALWERFKAAQDAFFSAKDAVAAKEDEEFRGNLAVKEGLLKEAQSILPVTDIDVAKAALRTIQEKWEAAGKVPRGDVDRMEKGLRRIESAVREADEKRWAQTNPEVAARAQSMVDQLESSVASLREDLATAQASGNEKKVAEAKAKLEAQEQWLAQARGNLDEFGA